MNNKQTVFQFSLKPKYISKPINYQKAYVKNIVRSLYVNKLRFFKKWLRFKQTQNQVSVIKNSEQLKLATSLVRPGSLISNK